MFFKMFWHMTPLKFLKTISLKQLLIACKPDGIGDKYKSVKPLLQTMHTYIHHLQTLPLAFFIYYYYVEDI